MKSNFLSQNHLQVAFDLVETAEAASKNHIASASLRLLGVMLMLFVHQQFDLICNTQGKSERWMEVHSPEKRAKAKAQVKIE